MYASKEATGNPKLTAAHGKVDQAADLLTDFTDIARLLEAGEEAMITSDSTSVNIILS